MRSLKPIWIWGACLAGAVLGTSLRLDAAAVLELERSTDAKTWKKVPLDPAQLTATGGIMESGTEPQALYRLRINDGQQAGFVPALPLAEATPAAVAVAEQFLRDLLVADADGGGDDPEGGWIDVRLGPVCYPVYDPAYQDGKVPAYLEFKLIRATATPLPPTRDPAFGMSPPDTVDDQADFGHLLVSLTKDDVPVPGYSQGGATPVERLLRSARSTGPLRIVRYDDGLMVAEDAQGAIAASIGNEPFLVDPKVLELAGKEFVGHDGVDGTRDDGAPELPARAYESYRAFKEDFVRNPLYAELRRRRAEQAVVEWKAIAGEEPATIRVAPSARTLVLETRFVASAVVADPKVAVANVPTGGPGLLITGQTVGGTLLEVTFRDGSRETFILLVGLTRITGASVNVATAGWTSWKYWYAGTWSDQRRYQQYSKDPQMCPGGASGCGPAAWAMLYGWWDRQGSPRLMKSTSQADAPLYNDDSVRDCQRYVFDQVGPFCVNGQAATMPWNMKWGYKWAQHRSAGRDVDWTWGLPYMSPGSVSMVASSIKAGRPAILGLGYYWHYPLAYGYKAREYKTGSITWSTQRYFKCNMGWGGSSAEWRNASSTWFGTNARYW